MKLLLPWVPEGFNNTIIMDCVFGLIPYLKCFACKFGLSLTLLLGLPYLLRVVHTLANLCIALYWTIIPWAHVGYEMVNPANEARRAELAITNLISNKREFKVSEHSFQVPMPNSPFLLNYLCFGARFLQESRLITEVCCCHGNGAG